MKTVFIIFLLIAVLGSFARAECFFSQKEMYFSGQTFAGIQNTVNVKIEKKTEYYGPRGTKAVHFSGTYKGLDASGKPYEGTLQFTAYDENKCTMSGAWKDPWGSGRVEYQFDPELKSFKGKFGTGNAVPTSPWNGDQVALDEFNKELKPPQLGQPIRGAISGALLPMGVLLPAGSKIPAGFIGNLPPGMVGTLPPGAQPQPATPASAPADTSSGTK